MQTSIRPWYKEPYVWMLIGFPLKLSHPTLVGKDRDSMLQLTANKTYQGFIEETESTRFYIQIESLEQSWRVRGEVYISQGTPLELTAKM